MNNKKEWLEMIEVDIESLVEWSKTEPNTFNRVICEQELKKLKEMAANLAATLEKESNRAA